MANRLEGSTEPPVEQAIGIVRWDKLSYFYQYPQYPFF